MTLLNIFYFLEFLVSIPGKMIIQLIINFPLQIINRNNEINIILTINPILGPFI